MNNLFLNLGCSLDFHNKQIQEKLLATLANCGYDLTMHNICCHQPPQLEVGSKLFHLSIRCANRSVDLHKNITTQSFWEFVDSIENFPFPDYQGMKMSIHDPCPAKKYPGLQQAVRSLLKKMNIEIVETKHHGSNSLCCGNSLYNKIPMEKFIEYMKIRANSMPCQEVAVYCVACIKPISVGGRTPKYILDLMLNEPTTVSELSFEEWGKNLSAHRETRA